MAKRIITEEGKNDRIYDGASGIPSGLGMIFFYPPSSCTFISSINFIILNITKYNSAYTLYNTF